MALAEYEEILAYGERNPEVAVDENMAMELKLCAEMAAWLSPCSPRSSQAALLPSKLARMARS